MSSGVCLGSGQWSGAQSCGISLTKQVLTKSTQVSGQGTPHLLRSGWIVITNQKRHLSRQREAVRQSPKGLQAILNTGLNHTESEAKSKSPTSSCVWPTQRCSLDICWKNPNPTIELHHDPIIPFLHSCQALPGCDFKEVGPDIEFWNDMSHYSCPLECYRQRSWGLMANTSLSFELGSMLDSANDLALPKPMTIL